MNNNPKWLNDALRESDRIIQEGRARDEALEQDRKLMEKLQNGEGVRPTGATGRASLADIIEGVQALVAGAVGILGLIVGASVGGWTGAIVLGVIGFFGTVFLFLVLGERFRDMAEKRLWSQRPHARTSAELREMWEAKFGTPLHEELIDEIAMNGAAWVMDRNANFILRMNTGDRLFVGYKDGSNGIWTEKRGGRGFDARDAYRMMLARLSAGADSCKPNGTKQANARMWAAAKLLGIKVNGYEPDARALQAYKQMQRDFAIPASVGKSDAAGG